jgi:hypothetical protein
MIIINFSHPLTDEQLARVQALTGHPVERLINMPVQFDHQQPFEPQLAALLGGLDLPPDEWQTAPIIINPPSLNSITALVLAELHGRMGYFPPIVRLRPVAGSMPPRYEVAEVFNLQRTRDAARIKRQ